MEPASQETGARQKGMQRIPQQGKCIACRLIPGPCPTQENGQFMFLPLKQIGCGRTHPTTVLSTLLAMTMFTLRTIYLNINQGKRICPSSQTHKHKIGRGFPVLIPTLTELKNWKKWKWTRDRQTGNKKKRAIIIQKRKVRLWKNTGKTMGVGGEGEIKINNKKYRRGRVKGKKKSERHLQKLTFLSPCFYTSYINNQDFKSEKH